MINISNTDFFRDLMTGQLVRVSSAAKCAHQMFRRTKTWKSGNFFTEPILYYRKDVSEKVRFLEYHEVTFADIEFHEEFYEENSITLREYINREK